MADLAVLLVLAALLLLGGWMSVGYARTHPRLFVLAVLGAVLFQFAVLSCFRSTHYPHGGP